MQKEISGFNRAFVRLATGYVESLEARVKGNTTYSAEPQVIFRLGTSLADEVRVANLLAVTIGRMNTEQGGEFDAGEPGAEPVKLGPGASFRMENTRTNPCGLPDGEEMTMEDMIRQTVREVFKEWTETAKDGGCIVIPQEEAARIEREAAQEAQDAAAGTDTAPAADSQQDAPSGAWELLRDILTGKQPIPQGTVFNVTIDTGGSPQAVKMKTEPDAPQDAAEAPQEGN